LDKESKASFVAMELPVYFISDLHLMLRLTPEEKIRRQKLFRFFDHISSTGGTLFINGDIFDFYFEYKHVIPKMYFDFYYEINKLRNNGVKIHFMLGNHDYWVMDFITEQLSHKTYFEDLSLEISGKRFFITHGDGYLSWDRGYRLLRSIIRSRLFIWLYRWVHPRVGYGFAQWISKKGEHYIHSDEYNQRVQTEMGKHARLKFDQNYDFFITGHYHQAQEIKIDTGKLFILGDWLGYFSYAEFDGKNMKLKYWEKDV